MTSFFHKKYITFCINVFVGLFFTTVLIFKKGYSYVPITLGAVSIIYIIVYFIKSKLHDELSKIDKTWDWRKLANVSVYKNEDNPL